MFKIVATPELKGQVGKWNLNPNWLKKGYWLCVDPINKRYGYVENPSINSEKYTELKKLNQEILTQLCLLHSLGLSPKEIAEIING